MSESTLPVELRSAEEMYSYSESQGFGTGFGKSWGLRNFGVIEKNLGQGESVFLTFVGLNRFRSMATHQRMFAYAFSNKRILLAQVRAFRHPRFESIPLSSLINLSFDYEENIGVMKIMTPREAITVGMSQECAQALADKLTQLLPLIRSLAQEMSSQ